MQRRNLLFNHNIIKVLKWLKAEQIYPDQARQEQANIFFYENKVLNFKNKNKFSLSILRIVNF